MQNKNQSISVYDESNWVSNSTRELLKFKISGKPLILGSRVSLVFLGTRLNYMAGRLENRRVFRWPFFRLFIAWPECPLFIGFLKAKKLWRGWKTFRFRIITFLIVNFRFSKWYQVDPKQVWVTSLIISDQFCIIQKFHWSPSYSGNKKLRR